MSEIEEKILADKPANLYRGIEGVGGRIKVTIKSIIFTPHAFNIQKVVTEFHISSIKKIERANSLFFIKNKMIVILESGVVHKFVVSGRESLIDTIEEQMKACK